MAQLVARLVRNEKVGGSNPPSSTTDRHPIADVGFLYAGASCCLWRCGCSGRCRAWLWDRAAQCAGRRRPARSPSAPRAFGSARRLVVRPGPATAHGHRSLALRSLRRPPVRPATLVKPSSLLLACALSPVKPTTPLHARYTCFAAISSSKGVMGFTQARRGPRIGVDGFISRRGKRYGRDKVRPAPTVDGDSVKIFAQRGQNGPKWTFYGVLGEFFRGNGAHGLVLGEFLRPPAP